MKLLKYLAIIALSLGLLVFIIALVVYSRNEHLSVFQSTPNDEKLSSLGSLLSGVVGTLWSLGSVLLFYLALRHQQNDSKDNKEELEETRKIYAQQAKTQTIQRFENTFFHLLELHAALVIALRLPGGIVNGRDCFRSLNNSIKRSLGGSTGPTAIIIYTSLFNGNQESFSHYFRNFYYVLSFVDRADIDDKPFYAGLFRAQLSAHELSVAFYFGLTPDGVSLKPLFERLELFKETKLGNIHVPNNDLFKAYQSRAYGYSSYDFLNSPFLALEDIED